MFENANPPVVKSIKHRAEPRQLIVWSDDTRISTAHRHTGKGYTLDAYVGVRFSPFVVLVHCACARRALPVYTIAHIDDIGSESSPVNDRCCRSRMVERSRMRPLH